MSFKALLIYAVAAIFEIAGGYLIWTWVKQGQGHLTALLGALLLISYGVIIAQPQLTFGRAYIAYGGIFTVLAGLWAWKVDGFRPDVYDLTGAVVILIGVSIMLFAPRA